MMMTNYQLGCGVEKNSNHHATFLKVSQGNIDKKFKEKQKEKRLQNSFRNWLIIKTYPSRKSQTAQGLSFLST